jgi:hypothetical protein
VCDSHLNIVLELAECGSAMEALETYTHKGAGMPEAETRCGQQMQLPTGLSMIIAMLKCELIYTSSLFGAAGHQRELGCQQTVQKCLSLCI